jgi:hypothetical protein
MKKSATSVTIKVRQKLERDEAKTSLLFVRRVLPMTQPAPTF